VYIGIVFNEPALSDKTQRGTYTNPPGRLFAIRKRKRAVEKFRSSAKGLLWIIAFDRLNAQIDVSSHDGSLFPKLSAFIPRYEKRFWIVLVSNTPRRSSFRLSVL